jgi:hypothetical protein
MYRSVFPPQGVEDGVFLPASPRASKAFAGYDESEVVAYVQSFQPAIGSDNPGSRYPSLSHHTPRSHFIAECQAMRYI